MALVSIAVESEALGSKWRKHWQVGFSLLPALVFLWLTTVRLDAQGLYYDELHQATGAFTYVGSPPEMFALYPIHGLPMLNMPYSGAIKTAIYGLYLRFVNPEFSVLSWRLLGILFVVVGLTVFTLLAQRSISPLPLATILSLLLTDATILLCTRHDWGPVALALALRLVLLGIWLRGEGIARPSLRNSFALGALVGIAVFEKLSSWVLLPALGWMVLLSKRYTKCHWLIAASGVLLGALPLIGINAASFLTRGELVSLTDKGTTPDRSWWTFLQHSWTYLELGAGEQVRQLIFGLSAPAFVRMLEPCVMAAAVLLAGGIAGLARFREPIARLTLVALGCYVSIGIAFLLFPRPTWVHHWVLGTPFQYLAIGLSLESLKRSALSATTTTRVPGLMLGVVVGVLLAIRLIGVISLESALQRGEAALRWRPDFTRLGQFAATRVNEAIFVAADWGVATQIYCFANGRPNFVHQVFWSYRGPEDLLRLQQQSGRRALYAVALDPSSEVTPEITRRIFRDLERSPYWRETQVEQEFANLAAVTVRKFLYDPS